MGKPTKKKDDGRKVVASNRKARFQYHILDRIEAGIALRGTEVKSLREGNANLTDSYGFVQKGEIFLRSLHIGEYRQGSWTNHEPKRTRKLLLHRRQILKLGQKVKEDGLTLVPLSVYFNPKGFVKVELGVVKGKKLHDKRESMKKQEAAKEIARHMSGRGRDGW